MRNDSSTRILRIDASARRLGSTTRALTGEIIEALEARHGDLEIMERDLADGVGFVDDRWIDANFTPAEDRSPEQREALAASDALVAELQGADILVIGTPIYNFGVPAALKAWVDMIARARLTFRYTEHGPVGLLEGKKAYLVVASGGTPVDGNIDFATPYLRQALKFVGITDVDVIRADRLNARGAEALDDARAQIGELIHATPLRRMDAA